MSIELTPEQKKLQIFLDATKIDVSKELKLITNSKITKDNAMSLVLHGVLLMRKYSNLSGEQKKNTLVQALSIVVEEQVDLSEEDRLAINLMLEIAVPQTIDSLVSIANMGIKMKNTFCSCLPC